MPSPNLADLDAFAEVARARSFRGAAYVRGVSASVLSDAVRRLEARLGVRLLNRTTRSVTPTEAGQRLLDRITPALGEMAAAVDSLHADAGAPAGTLRLNVPSIAARLLLPEMIARFLLAYPHVRVELVADDTFIDVLGAGFDAGIRYDERMDRDMIAVPIGPRVQRFLVAGSPGWLAEHGTPRHPDDLPASQCLGHRFASGLVPAWEFEQGAQLIRIAPAGRVISSSVELAIQAAIAGLGLVCTFEEFLQPALRSGQLRTMLEDWFPPFPGPSLYYASRRQMPSALRAFVDFVRAEQSRA